MTPQDILALEEKDCIHEKLSPTQLKAVFLLAEGSLTLVEIARQLGISRDLLFKWRRDPDFEEFLMDELDSLLNDLRIKHKPLLGESFDTLAQIIRQQKVDQEDFNKGKICIGTIESIHKSIDVLANVRILKKQAQKIKELEAAARDFENSNQG